jgi:exopolysaccharide production protein ExoZ
MAGAKIQSLQILRFVAAALVVSVHAEYFANTLAGIETAPRRTGAVGVDIFFVLSGFIIFNVAFARRTTPIPFLWDRFTRIAPIFWLVNFAWLPVQIPIGAAASATFSNVAVALSFWPVWKGLSLPALGVGWTLCFEMLFYLCTALVLARRAWLAALLPAFIAAWLARDALGWDSLRILGNPIILEFMVGLIIAFWWRQGRRVHFLVGASLIAVAAFWLANLQVPPGFGDLGATLNGDWSAARVLVWGTPAAMIVIGALILGPYLSGSWVKLPVFLGDASYSIYLVHWPAIAIIAWFIGAYAPVPSITMPLLLLAGIASGALLHYFVERPLLRAVRSLRSITARQSPTFAAR